MKIISYYIANTITKMIAVVSVAIIAMDLFIQFSVELADIGTGNYNLSHAFLYILLNLPADFYQFFPVICLVGCMLGLGLLAAHSELIIIRTNGWSLIKLTKVILAMALFLMIIILPIGEIAAPQLQNVATHYKKNALTGNQTLYTENGIWLRHEQSFINIGTILTNNHIQNITRYQFDQNNNLQNIAFAKEALLQNNEWIFHDVEESNFTPNRIITKHYDQQPWNINIAPTWLTLANQNDAQRTLPNLYLYINYLRDNGLDTAKYKLAFWQRIVQPLALLVMIMLALPFIFGPLRNATLGLRLLAGVVVGLIFYTLNQFAAPFALVYQIPALAAAVIPILTMATLGGYLIYQFR